MADFNAKIKTLVDILQSDASGAASEEGSFSQSFDAEFDYGTGDNQATAALCVTRTLAASANEDLSLNGGALKDVLGNIVAFTKIKMLLLIAAAANGGTVTIKPSSVDPFNGPFAGTTPSNSVGPAGVWQVRSPVTGYTVTASTGMNINIANGDSVNPAVYTLIAIGN